jgi:hypothetical protein
MFGVTCIFGRGLLHNLTYKLKTLSDQFLGLNNVFCDSRVVLVVLKTDELGVDKSVFDTSVSEQFRAHTGAQAVLRKTIIRQSTQKYLWTSKLIRRALMCL